MSISVLNPELNFDFLRRNSGKGVEVAVIDSGIDPFHPDLIGKVSRSITVYKDDAGVNQVEELSLENTIDDFGHGTAVAGVISSIAPDAKLVNIRVLNEYNSCTGDILIRALEWALEQNIKLINMSLATSKKVFSDQLMELCERAYRQDAILVVSRRNYGPLGSPAMFSSVVSVEIGEDFEKTYDFKYKTGNMIECDAHGVNIRVPTPHDEGYAEQTGTSFATPHVTGFTALMLESFPDLVAAECKAILKNIQNKA